MEQLRAAPHLRDIYSNKYQDLSLKYLINKKNLTPSPLEPPKKLNKLSKKVTITKFKNPTKPKPPKILSKSNS